MKKIILLSLLTLSLSAEILVVKETNHMRQPETKISFREGHVTIYKEKKSMFDTGYNVVKTYTYEDYLSKQCKGRKYHIISANFGVKYADNFVINCQKK